MKRKALKSDLVEKVMRRIRTRRGFLQIQHDLKVESNSEKEESNYALLMYRGVHEAGQ